MAKKRTEILILKITMVWAAIAQGMVIFLVMQAGRYVYNGDNLALTIAFIISQTAFTCLAAIYVCRLWDKIQRGEI